MERWKTIDSVPAIVSKWLRVDRNCYLTSAGRLRDYYILTRNDFVLVIASDDDSIVLVRQYRPATDRFYLAVPGGYIEPGETEISAARREFREETGHDAVDWNYLGQLHPLPGYICSTAHVFHCRIMDGVASDTLTELDALEGIEVVRLGKEIMFRKIADGEINEMQTVAAIFLARLKGHV